MTDAPQKTSPSGQHATWSDVAMGGLIILAASWPYVLAAIVLMVVSK